MKYRVKDEIWLAYLRQNNKDLSTPNPGYQEVLYAPDHPPFNECVELIWPRWWWKMSEVEVQ